MLMILCRTQQVKFLIQYSEGLNQHIEGSLRSSFHQPLLSLSRPPGTKKLPEFHIRLKEDLQGSRLTAHEDDGTEVVVMEIITPEGLHSHFWFTFVAAFRQEHSAKQSLMHASLLIFHEIAKFTHFSARNGIKQRLHAQTRSTPNRIGILFSAPHVSNVSYGVVSPLPQRRYATLFPTKKVIFLLAWRIAVDFILR